MEVSSGSIALQNRIWLGKTPDSVDLSKLDPPPICPIFFPLDIRSKCWDYRCDSPHPADIMGVSKIRGEVTAVHLLLHYTHSVGQFNLCPFLNVG